MVAEAQLNAVCWQPVLSANSFSYSLISKYTQKADENSAKRLQNQMCEFGLGMPCWRQSLRDTQLMSFDSHCGAVTECANRFFSDQMAECNAPQPLQASGSQN